MPELTINRSPESFEVMEEEPPNRVFMRFPSDFTFYAYYPDYLHYRGRWVEAIGRAVYMGMTFYIFQVGATAQGGIRYDTPSAIIGDVEGLPWMSLPGHSESGDA